MRDVRGVHAYRFAPERRVDERNAFQEITRVAAVSRPERQRVALDPDIARADAEPTDEFGEGPVEERCRRLGCSASVSIGRGRGSYGGWPCGVKATSRRR